jgi:hypothetical protein
MLKPTVAFVNSPTTLNARLALERQTAQQATTAIASHQTRRRPRAPSTPAPPRRGRSNPRGCCKARCSRARAAPSRFPGFGSCRPSRRTPPGGTGCRCGTPRGPPGTCPRGRPSRRRRRRAACCSPSRWRRRPRGTRSRRLHGGEVLGVEEW